MGRVPEFHPDYRLVGHVEGNEQEIEKSRERLFATYEVGAFSELSRQRTEQIRRWYENTDDYWQCVRRLTLKETPPRRSRSVFAWLKNKLRV